MLTPTNAAVDPPGLPRPVRITARSSDILQRPFRFGDRDGDLSGYHPMERPVASVCDVCGKRPGFGNNVSHSHRRTPRRWNPNIQRIRAKVDGSPRRLYVCTSCIKAGKVER
jgi:large subunit ribosomal protein L28